eukprot:TRINITY_DN6997_c0_g2_i1.p1 TRINITY_DN6997_c0_g2~~TRINITY_DN6997_c0_g2_i1.p1  ORF type:complete len:390 (+),score=58.86 TRINITY_DN6997_c0_g2_i1:18-1187(+)
MGNEAGKETKPPEEGDVFGLYLQKSSDGQSSPRDVRVSDLPYSRKDAKISEDDFEVLYTIGRGRFGIVDLVRKKNTNEMYAMKILDKKEIVRSNEIEHTMTERTILADHDHPFLMHLKYAFQSDRHLFLVLQFANGGDFWSHLRSGAFDEDRARFYAAEIVLALEYLHNRSIVYRDLKPENILLDHEGHVVLTDFGLAKRLRGDSTTTFCGTPEYISPEVLQGKEYGIAVDWWSFGALLFEMLLARPPFYSPNLNKMYKAILTKRPMIPRDAMSPAAADLCLKLLEKDPSKRLALASDVKRHPFFATVNWSAVYERRVRPPFVPNVASPTDLAMCDLKWINRSPINHHGEGSGSQPIRSANHFEGFSYGGSMKSPSCSPTRRNLTATPK